MSNYNNYSSSDIRDSFNNIQKDMYIIKTISFEQNQFLLFSSHVTYHSIAEITLSTNL